MSKLAFIGLDGIVVNCEKRLALAESVRQKYTQSEHAKFRNRAEKVGDALYWDTALSSKYIHLDTVIEEVPDALNRLEAQGYIILFLTARPEHMKAATEEWMKRRQLLIGNRRLLMKPESAKKIPDARWTVDRLHEIASLKAKEVLLIDTPAVCAELTARTKQAKYSVVTWNSVAEACETTRARR